MVKEDISMLEIMSAKYKARYDQILTVVGGDKKIFGLVVFVPIDLTGLVNEFLDFKEALTDTEDFDLHASVTILNLYAHYKHYFMLHKAQKAIVIGYVKDKYNYGKAKHILNMVVDFCNFFPGVYTVPDIYENNHYYIHAVCAILIYMKKMVRDSKTGILCVGANVVNRQLMYLFANVFAYSCFRLTFNQHMKFVSKMDHLKRIIGGEKLYYSALNKHEIQYLNVFLARFMNFDKSYHNLLPKKTGKNIIRFTKRKTQDKIKMLSTFLVNVYDPERAEPMSVQFYLYVLAEGMFADKESYENFRLYLRLFDYRFQNQGRINEVIVPLLRSWSKKVKDFAINRQSESYKRLIKHQLYVNWLNQ